MPAGRFSARDGRGPFVAGDLVSLQAIVARTRRYHGKTDMVVDYDHQSFFGVRPEVAATAKASGWIKEIEARSDGIYGRIEWTPAARAAIAAGEYRYLSPVMATDKGQDRVSVILSVALTNVPALDMEAVAASVRHDLTAKRMETMDNPESGALAALVTALGLAADSGKETVKAKLDEVGRLAKDAHEAGVRFAFSGQPDPAEFVPMSVFRATVAELNSLRQGVTRETAERHVGEQIAAGRIMPFMRDWAVELCTTNMQAFDAFAAGIGPSVSTLIEPQHGGGKRADTPAALTAAQEQVRKNLGLTVEEYMEAAR